MSSNRSSYQFWSWLVAILLALILLWMLLTGRGIGNACCAAPAAAHAEVAATAPVPAAPVAEACHFVATAADFSSTGDCAKLAWLNNSDQAKAMLSGDMRAEGDDKSVILTGAVESEEIKTNKGAEAQAFYGAGVSVDNQLLVKAPEPIVVETPPSAKVYFDTGKTNLRTDGKASLEPVIAWLQSHPSAKAVVSGFHDPRGGAAINAALAKGRAQKTTDAIIAAGIDASRIEMREPSDENGGGDLQEARRVEVTIE